MNPAPLCTGFLGQDCISLFYQERFLIKPWVVHVLNISKYLLSYTLNVKYWKSSTNNAIYPLAMCSGGFIIAVVCLFSHCWTREVYLWAGSMAGPLAFCFGQGLTSCLRQALNFHLLALSSWVSRTVGLHQWASLLSVLLLSTKTFHTSPDVSSQLFPSSLVHSSFKKEEGNQLQSQKQNTNKKTVVACLRDSVAG